jgi:hypothetical protein
MDMSRPGRWSGMCAMGTGILWILWTVAPWSPLLIPALLLAVPAIYGLHKQHAADASWWSWLGCMLGIGGAAAGAVLVTFAQQRDSVSAGTLGLLALGVMAGGLMFLGVMAVRSAAPTRLMVPPLMLAALIPVYLIWFRLFILYRPYPSLTVLMIWVALGIIIGMGWGYVGQTLIRTTDETSSSQVH